MTWTWVTYYPVDPRQGVVDGGAGGAGTVLCSTERDPVAVSDKLRQARGRGLVARGSSLSSNKSLFIYVAAITRIGEETGKKNGAMVSS